MVLKSSKGICKSWANFKKWFQGKFKIFGTFNLSDFQKFVL